MAGRGNKKRRTGPVPPGGPLDLVNLGRGRSQEVSGRMVPAVGREGGRRKPKPTNPGWDWFDPLPGLKAATEPEKRPPETRPTPPEPPTLTIRARKPTAPGVGWDFLDRPVGRPARSTETKEAILAAALVEFAERGYHGGRMERIASAAGCNKAMLHYYFQGKSGLYRQVLAEAVGEALTGLESILANNPSPRQLLTGLIETLTGLDSDNAARVRLLRREIISGGRELTGALEPNQTWPPPAVSRLIKALRPALRPGLDPGRVLAWLVGAIMSAGLAEVLAGSTATREADQLTGLILRGALKPD